MNWLKFIKRIDVVGGGKLNFNRISYDYYFDGNQTRSQIKIIFRNSFFGIVVVFGIQWRETEKIEIWSRPSLSERIQMSEEIKLSIKKSEERTREFSNN